MVTSSPPTQSVRPKICTTSVQATIRVGDPPGQSIISRAGAVQCGESMLRPDGLTLGGGGIFHLGDFGSDHRVVGMIADLLSEFGLCGVQVTLLAQDDA